MIRKGFTLTELLIVVAILAVLGMLIFGGVGGCANNYYQTSRSGVYQCVKTYTVNVRDTLSSKRVDLRSKDGAIETFSCDDDYRMGVTNSATLYAQFETGKWFSVTSVGYRREGMMALFANVTAVSSAPDPNQ